MIIKSDAILLKKLDLLEKTDLWFLVLKNLIAFKINRDCFQRCALLLMPKGKFIEYCTLLSMLAGMVGFKSFQERILVQ